MLFPLPLIESINVDYYVIIENIFGEKRKPIKRQSL